MPIFYAWKQGKRSGRSTLAGVAKLAAKAPVTFWRPKPAPPGARIVRVAASQLGTVEQPPGSNRGPRVEQYQASDTVPGAGYAWCMSFVRWTLDKAGVLVKGYRGAYVPHFEAWARAAGRWHGPGATPQPGWAVVYTFTPGAGIGEHVGIVVRAVAGGVEAIEGNTTAPSAAGNQANGGGVYRRIRNARYVRGYIDTTKKG